MPSSSFPHVVIRAILRQPRASSAPRVFNASVPAVKWSSLRRPMFTCPNCGSGLTRTPNKVGIFWVCGRCGGQAVSVTLLRRTIGASRVQAIWSQTFGSPGNDGKSCPICLRGMVPVTMGVPGSKLDLDVCKRCQFVWFDAAEYESIPPPPPRPKDPFAVDEKDLPQAAREALALHRVRQIAEQANAENAVPDANWKAVPGLLGLPVEMDSDPLNRVPLATLVLSLLIAVVSLGAFSNLESAARNFGLIPHDAWRHGGLTFLTSFFLHGGLFHLGGNLYFLVVFGMPVENYLGSRRWLLLVLLAALTGNLLHVAADPRGDIPCIGASGGISGLIAFYAFKFPHAKLGILLRYYYVYLRWVQFPAWGAFVLWMLLQFWGVFEQFSGFSNVSALAHLGGTAVGIGMWAVWRKTDSQPGLPAATAAN
jgi:membrane associated rhomboid family serine protease/Zn-finger nucleic acid-binding protein